MPALAVTVMLTVTWSAAPGEVGKIPLRIMTGCDWGAASTVAIAGRSSKNDRASAILLDVGDNVFPEYYDASGKMPLL